MLIKVTEAAEMVGMSKNGIIKSIKSGKLSAEKNVHGQWMVDAAELFRVYPKSEKVDGRKIDKVGVGSLNENNALEKEIELMREQINTLREQLSKSDRQLIEAKHREDKILEMMDEQITYIRMLTDQRKEKKTEEGRGLWRRLFR